MTFEDKLKENGFSLKKTFDNNVQMYENSFDDVVFCRLNSGVYHNCYFESIHEHISLVSEYVTHLKMVSTIHRESNGNAVDAFIRSGNMNLHVNISEWLSER